jgi:hypothetical protein
MAFFRNSGVFLGAGMILSLSGIRLFINPERFTARQD